MNPAVNTIANRLSLRSPQRISLEILARICDIISLEKGADVAQAIKAVQSEFSTVTDFERDFPSLCFALATGVGKTRLMGAFIAYLHKAEGIRHFFVLAPNLTIYNKLIADFTPNMPKYVFQGIAEFAVEPPEIITGDNYESGRGVRSRDLFGDKSVHVNIFNIGKITSIETPKGAVKTNVQKFDSDSERRFAVILEHDGDVLKWFRPSKGDIPIYHSGDTLYEPDFVVETKMAKFVCETKRADELEDVEVLAKAKAAAEWCGYATTHEGENGGKPWTYLLIPHDVITDNKTLKGLAASYTYRG